MSLPVGEEKLMYKWMNGHEHDSLCFRFANWVIFLSYKFPLKNSSLIILSDHYAMFEGIYHIKDDLWSSYTKFHVDIFYIQFFF